MGDATQNPPRRRLSGLAVPALLAIAVALFYWIPLTSQTASIQWDAADIHYPLQKYLADRIHTGKLPFWTPYVFSGYPLLANPKTGAFYPANWPFLLAGIRPRSIEYELALNAFLACLGAYYFFRRLKFRESAAVFGALLYGLSGYFAAHSSHVGLFCAAACFPWVLVAYRRALESAGLRNTALGAAAGGCMYLTGGVQAAVFGFVGLGLLALADLMYSSARRTRILFVAGGMLGLSLALTAVQSLPALELSRYAVASPDYSSGLLRPKALLTLVYPDAYGVISGTDKERITEHYYYSGILLLPLAAIGLCKTKYRREALFLIVPLLWYMFGKSAGLYFAGVAIPGLQTGPPVVGWFVLGLGLAIAAAAGAEWLSENWNISYLTAVLAILVFADVFYWNSYRNPLAYARDGFEKLYGSVETMAKAAVARPQLPLSRFESPTYLSGLGPMLHPLDMKFETSYGYLTGEPRTYAEYRAAMLHNPKLRSGLNVSRFLNLSTMAIDVNADVLPRAYFPRAIEDVSSDAESRRALETLDPLVKSVVLGPHDPIQQDPAARPFMIANDEQSYRVHYQAAKPSLLKLAVDWFPGWHASLGGEELPIVRVDHAMMGAVAPAGEGEVDFFFRSNHFGTGLTVSVLTLAILLMLAWIKHAHRITGGRSRRVKKRRYEVSVA